MSTFLAALGIGVAVAAPLGPIGFLCIQRTLHSGWRIGVASGVGIAAADALYASLGGFGIGLGGLIGGAETTIRIAGALVLLWIGYSSFTRRATGTRTPQSRRVPARLGAFGSGFALTLSNPMTVLHFAAIFAGMGVASASTGEVVVFAAGVASGSLIWWIGLSSAIALLRDRITSRVLQGVSKIGGAVLAVVACLMLVDAF